MIDILPSSRLSRPMGSKPNVFGPVAGVPIYCANCGTRGPLAPDVEGLQLKENFHCWLCEKCAETWGPLLGAQLMPDEAFFRKVKEAQIDKYHRELTAEEMRQQLGDPDSLMGKLARER